MNLKLEGSTVIVTGGTKGIGAGISEVLAEEGCNVAVNYRSNKSEAEKFAKSLRENYHVMAAAICADVSEESQVDTLFEQVEKLFGQVHILVNNAAGGYQPNAFQNISADEWRGAGEGLLSPTFYMSRKFLQYCVGQNQEGHIVNILSKSAILSSSINNLAYVTYKGALVALTRGMAKEFIQYGIYVNGIVPGYVKTERMHVEGEERTERVRSLLPTGEFAKPRDIGYAAAMLASPLFKQMIGAVVDCSGGTLI